MVLFKQISKFVEQFHKMFARFDMSHDEFKELRRDAWKDEEYKYLTNI